MQKIQVIAVDPQFKGKDLQVNDILRQTKVTKHGAQLIFINERTGQEFSFDFSPLHLIAYYKSI
jgi:hypothetical protein